MDNNVYQIKYSMLDNFEKQLDYIINQYNENKITFEDTSKYIQKLKNAWNINRIDFKNKGNKNNSLKFIEYEKSIKILHPKWFKDETGEGTIVSYKNMDTKLFVQTVNEGIFEIMCRGIDFNNIDQKRVPIYTNYTKIVLNNKTLFEGNKLSWHNKLITFKKECKDSEIIYLNIESKTIYDYYPELMKLLEKLTKESELNNYYELIKDYITSNKENIETLIVYSALY